ncbi:MAG: DUF692 domain-containing protein [bacterium]|nr:DUF692 domain-containing protein [bacterium]
MTTSELKRIPYLGIGMGLRDEIDEEIMDHKDRIDALEIISERFFDTRALALDRLNHFADHFSIIPHGVKLSIASAQETEEKFLKNMKTLCEFVKAPYYSDHFALTRLPGVDIGHLSPIWFTREALDLMIRKINTIQNFLGIPLVLENISSLFTIAHGDFEEPEFITQACKQTGCGLLLDVTNVYINSYNRNQDPYAFLERLPLDHVVQIHLAGGKIKHERFLDTHSEEIDGDNEGVWKLLEWVVQRCDIKALIIERDQNFKKDFDTMILKDLAHIQEIVAKYGNRASPKNIRSLISNPL